MDVAETDDDLLDDPPASGSVDRTGAATASMTTFQQCQRCGTFVTSSGAVQLHVDRCRMKDHVNSGWEGGQKFEDGFEEESMNQVVTFPVGRVNIMRLSAAEIEEMAGRRKDQHRFQKSSSPTPAKVPRQSSLKARLKIRKAAREIIENEDKGDSHRHEEDLGFSSVDELANCDPEQDYHSDDQDEVEQFRKSKSITRRHRLGKRSVPVLQNVKKIKINQAKLVRKGKTSDELYSFHCPKCAAFFNSQPSLEKHVEAVHEDVNHQSDVIQCQICDKMVWRRMCFHAHIRHHTDAEALEDAFKIWEQWPKPKNQMGEKMRFSCKYCLMPHLSHHSFLSHMKTRHPDKPKGYKWTCQYCSTDDEDFDTLYLFVGHMREHHHEEFFGDPLKWHDLDHEPKQNCDICGKLLNIYHLKEHKLKQHPGGKDVGAGIEDNARRYPCPLCPKRLKSVQFLKDHFIALHLKNNPFTCKFPGCSSRYDNQSHLNRHMRIHTGGEMAACPKCGLSYSKKTLQSRTHICGGVDPKNVRILPDGSKMAHHSKTRLKRFHKSEISEELQGGQPEKRVDINKIMKSDPVFIEACKKDPTFEKLMTTRMYVSRGKGLPRSTTVRCRKCNSFFTTRMGFAKHYSVCNGPIPNLKGDGEDVNPDIKMPVKPILSFDEISMKVGCPVCGSAFDTQELRNRHLEAEHDPEEIFKCMECSEIFAGEANMKNHITKVHAERPFQCSKCDSKFTTERILASHLERHESQVRKMHACPECGKVLSCGPSVRRHCLSAHGVTIPIETPWGGLKNGAGKKKKIIKKTAAPKLKRKRGQRQRKPETGYEDKTDNEIGKIQEEKVACRLVKVEPELIIETDITDNPSESYHEIIGHHADADIDIDIKKEASIPLIPVTKIEDEHDGDPYNG